MKPIPRTRLFLATRHAILFLAAIAVCASLPFALDGRIQIHDPSTIMQCDGKFYTYGTCGHGFDMAYLL